MTEPIIVAIDGPSGSGKSSVAKGVASRFGLAYLDTGAMYRAMTWFMLRSDVDVQDPAAIAARASDPAIVSGLDPLGPTISVDGVGVDEAIRTPEVTAAVSLVSAVPQVRETMVALQRSEAHGAAESGIGIIVEGRDIGSTVLPDASVKIFLTADASVRAQRRSAEDADREHGSAGVEATMESLKRRDQLDTQRKASPLRAASDAITVDATNLDLPGTIDAVAGHVEQALKAKGQ